MSRSDTIIWDEDNNVLAKTVSLTSMCSMPWVSAQWSWFVSRTTPLWRHEDFNCAKNRPRVIPIFGAVLRAINGSWTTKEIYDLLSGHPRTSSSERCEGCTMTLHEPVAWQQNRSKYCEECQCQDSNGTLKWVGHAHPSYKGRRRTIERSLDREGQHKRIGSLR
jgi:hypothetical protein